MAELYGKPIDRKELEMRAQMRQVAGVRLATLEEGVEQGVKVAEFRTGAGLNFTVAISRALDIFNAEYNGRALGFLSPLGLVAPDFYDPAGLGWLRSFGGGLLTTCGLTYLGAPDVDEGQPLGLHGRVSNLPASHVKVTEGWVGDDYELAIEGEVVEAVPVVGDFVRLKRRIAARLGEAKIYLSDVVENFGYKSVPHMILYHMNLGYPLLDAGARVVAPSLEAMPRDADAQVEADKWAEVLPPTPNFAERVYYHKLGADSAGRTTVALINPALDDGLAFYINFSRQQLPKFVQWKMCAAGNYVMGLEPGNCWVSGRSKARAAGELQFLEPGESRRYDLEVGVVSGAAELAQLEARIRALE